MQNYPLVKEICQSQTFKKNSKQINISEEVYSKISANVKIVLNNSLYYKHVLKAMLCIFKAIVIFDISAKKGRKRKHVLKHFLHQYVYIVAKNVSKFVFFCFISSFKNNAYSFHTPGNSVTTNCRKHESFHTTLLVSKFTNNALLLMSILHNVSWIE